MTALPPVFAAMLKGAGLPLPVREYRFHPTRKWRFDYAWELVPFDARFSPPAGEGVALEVQGGLFVQGRHSRGAALLKEHEKLNEAAVLGWRVLFCTPQTLCHLSTISLIRRALGSSVNWPTDPSRCDHEGCMNEGTEPVRDGHVCPTHRPEAA